MDSESSRSSFDPLEESTQRQQLLEKEDDFLTLSRPKKRRFGLSVWLLPVLTHLLLICSYTLAFVFLKTKSDSNVRLKDIFPYCRYICVIDCIE